MSVCSESIILVEGYDDRDFWKGMLLRLKCVEARKTPPSHHRAQGRYTYLTPAGKLLHVIPFRQSNESAGTSATELAIITKQLIRARINKPLQRLLLCPDADKHATLDAARKSIHAAIVSACPEALETLDGDYRIDDGNLIVSALFMHAGVQTAGENRIPGLPAQRALEQLACAALCHVYPERGEAVAEWLANRPSPSGKDHKALAWSFYAGWSTDHGTGDFYSSLWKDEPVAAELEHLLRAQGAFRIIDAVLAP